MVHNSDKLLAFENYSVWARKGDRQIEDLKTSNPELHRFLTCKFSCSDLNDVCDDVMTFIPSGMQNRGSLCDLIINYLAHVYKQVVLGLAA